MGKEKMSNIDVKRINRNRVYRYINKHSRLSRPDISHALGISSPTVLHIVGELLEKGLISEDGTLESTGGRKAKALSPIHDANYAVGLDIAQDHIGMVLTDLSGAVLKRFRKPKHFEYSEAYLEDISRELTDFIHEARVPEEKLLGAGISIPGIINARDRVLTVSHALKLKSIPCDEISKYIPFDCVFTNDANAAAIAEISCFENDSTALYLSLNNVVGGAVITPKIVSAYADVETSWCSENIYMGDNWKSGEIGHMTLIPSGKPCYCGQKGCLDAYCAAKNLAALTDGSLHLFFKRLDSDKKLQAVWSEYLRNLAASINSLRMLMDCNIIVGGDVGGYMEPHIGRLREYLREINTFYEDASYLRSCKYKVEASAFGAALLHIERFINSV